MKRSDKERNKGMKIEDRILKIRKEGVKMKKEEEMKE